MKVLILTDNQFAFETAVMLKRDFPFIDMAQSPNGLLIGVDKLDVKNNIDSIIANYKFVFSIHCKQIFPEELVNKAKCINVHPGYNPYNRGWFPQAFSIINGLKSGVTIHVIDEHLDHGPILFQEEYKIESWDTSESAYWKIMAIERKMLLKHFEEIIKGDFISRPMAHEGNLNLKRDFEKLKQFDLNEVNTFGNFLNRLRALSFDGYKNAYFITEDGRKVHITIKLSIDH